MCACMFVCTYVYVRVEIETIAYRSRPLQSYSGRSHSFLGTCKHASRLSRRRPDALLQAPRKRRQPLEIEVDDGRKVRKRKAFGSAKKGVFGRALIGEAGGGVSALSRGLADLGMLLGDTQTCSFDPVEPPLFLKPCHKPQAGGAGGRIFLNPAITRTIPRAHDRTSVCLGRN